MSWPPTPDRIFDLLLGTWHLERTIPGQATMQGRADILPIDPDAASYDEVVNVQTAAGSTLAGSAHYTFYRRAHGLDIHFRQTGKLFQALHFVQHRHGDLQAHAIHKCAADTYTSRYRLLLNQLEIEHIVDGPRKHYISRTTLTRSNQPLGPTP